MKKITFIFPVYKDGNIVENILKIFEDPYPSELKEIIISASSPTEEFLNKLKNLMHLKNVKLIISSERRGKVEATMDAVSYATGDIFVFLDADVTIEKINLYELLKEFDEADLVEFYKKVEGKSMLGKLYELEYKIYYDFFLPRFSKKRKSIFLGGAGFAIKREVWNSLGGYSKVITEDIDLAIKAYSKNYLYKLTKAITIKFDAVENFNKFIDQRIRWLSGVLELFLIHTKAFIEFFTKDPIFLFLFFIFSPHIVYFIFLLVFPYFIIQEISKTIYISLINNISLLYIFTVSLDTISKIFTFILYFLLFLPLILFTVLFIFLYKKKITKSALQTLLFIEFYLRLNIFLFIYILIHYILFEAFPKFDWKI